MFNLSTTGKCHCHAPLAVSNTPTNGRGDPMGRPDITLTCMQQRSGQLSEQAPSCLKVEQRAAGGTPL